MVATSMLIGRPKVKLKPGREKSARIGHPWIFSGAVDFIDAHATDGAIVDVLDSKGRFVATGHLGVKGIAVRLLSSHTINNSFGFIKDKIQSALNLRQCLGLTDGSKTTAWRLFNAEGDGISGLVIDVYNNNVLIQSHHIGIEKWRDKIIQSLKACLGDSVETMIWTSQTPGLRNQGKPKPEYIVGSATSTVIKENTLQFEVNWELGQKTGFFIDQRENRQTFGTFVRNKRVLNAFSYTGGFTLYALRGGATDVVSIDSSKYALETLEKNVSLNLKEKAPHETLCEDCFKYLSETKEKFDVIALDPPALVKTQKRRASGLKGYENINFNALRALNPGGVLFTFSCSQLISQEEFLVSVQKAVSRSRRSVKIVRHLSAAACHPVNPHHIEGNYLKGYILYVD